MNTNPRIVELVLNRWRREARVWFGKGQPLTETLFTWLGQAGKKCDSGQGGSDKVTQTQEGMFSWKYRLGGEPIF